MSCMQQSIKGVGWGEGNLVGMSRINHGKGGFGEKRGLKINKGVGEEGG